VSGAGARRRRAHLDRESILDAGIRLAAGGGEDALSVRKLGAELGADPTAIYRHFRDKEELLAALLDRLHGEAQERVDPSGTWRERMRTLADATLEVLLAHPAIGIEAGILSTDGPYERQAIELLLGALEEAGLDEPDVVRFYAVFTGHILAFASALSAALLMSDTPADPESAWIESLRVLDPDTHPLTTRYAARLMRLSTHEVFDAGVEVILDAVHEAGRGRRSRRRA
jgi:AcrR family transcriptional regulator